MSISERLLGKKNVNGKPHIEAVAPSFALPGGEVRIIGKSLRPHELRRPSVRFGDVEGSVLISSDDFIVARVPEGATSGPVVVSTNETGANGHVSNPHSIEVAVPVADNLHPVTNPALDREGNLYVTFSGSRPETQTRIDQYEMAFRMQTSVPELTNLAHEPKHILDMYGPDVLRPGTFAASCLLARRLAERDVRFVQIFHRGWDQHGNIAGDLPLQCRDVDQAGWALVQDLKQRGLLEDTLVIWGGEFGRTIYCQGGLTRENYGRDHHPRCFTMWMAGGGIRPGIVYGETDDFSYNIVDKPVHIHDLNATILHTLGIDNSRLTFRAQGLEQRLTGVEEHHAVTGLLV